MKERPILFSAPMVRALLDGSKTQTRRIVKGQTPDWATFTDEEDIHGREFFIVCGEKEQGGLRPILDAVYCPYGQPGDRLWVRETWQPDPENDGTWAYTQWAGCKGSPLSEIPTRFRKPEHCLHRATWTGADLVWRPSIHMPRWASRILLEVVSVRVERLQGIGSEEIEAEGVVTSDEDIMKYGCRARVIDFVKLWESINGTGNWDANPWVWVVEFKRVAP